MSIAFRTLGRTLRHGYENLFPLLAVSVLWYVGALLIVPLGGVTAALHRVTRPMTEERVEDWRLFFRYSRDYFVWGSKLVWVFIIGWALLWANITFYSAAPSTTLRFIGYLFGTLAIVWTGMGLFAFPLAVRQHEQGLRMTLRNAVVMVMANAPGVLISLALLILLLILLFVIPPLFLIVPGVVALWGEENVRMLLVATGHLEPDAFADGPRPPREKKPKPKKHPRQ
jgi:uncharacterized membrane protein YesL